MTKNKKLPVTNCTCVCISFNFIIFCVTTTILEVVDSTSSVHLSGKVEHSSEFVCSLLVALAMTIILYDTKIHY